KNRNKDVPPLKIADNIDNWIRDAADKELSIRKFLQERGILTVPDWIQHYTLRPTPEYLRALGFTENDDFTSASRLKENCIRYVPEPSEKLGYARDHLQFHAPARSARGGGRKTRARRIHAGTSCQISTGKSPDGRTNRAPGSNCVFHWSGSGHYVPNRKAADYKISRRRAHA